MLQSTNSYATHPELQELGGSRQRHFMPEARVDAKTLKSYQVYLLPRYLFLLLRNTVTSHIESSHPVLHLLSRRLHAVPSAGCLQEIILELPAARANRCHVLASLRRGTVQPAPNEKQSGCQVLMMVQSGRSAGDSGLSTS